MSISAMWDLVWVAEKAQILTGSLCIHHLVPAVGLI